MKAKAKAKAKAKPTKYQLARQLVRQQMWDRAVDEAEALRAGFCITARDASRTQL